MVVLFYLDTDTSSTHVSHSDISLTLYLRGALLHPNLRLWGTFSSAFFKISCYRDTEEAPPS